MKLNAAKLRNTKPKDKDYKLFDGEGLFLLVKKSGKMSWRLKYYFQGSEKLLTIGPYPVVSLQDARDEKLKAKKLIHDGIDPVAHRNEANDQAIKNAENTFQIIAYEWYENRKHMWKPR